MLGGNTPVIWSRDQQGDTLQQRIAHKNISNIWRPCGMIERTVYLLWSELVRQWLLVKTGGRSWGRTQAESLLVPGNGGGDGVGGDGDFGDGDSYGGAGDCVSGGVGADGGNSGDDDASVGGDACVGDGVVSDGDVGDDMQVTIKSGGALTCPWPEANTAIMFFNSRKFSEHRVNQILSS